MDLYRFTKALFINFRYYNFKAAVKFNIFVSSRRKFIKLGEETDLQGKPKQEVFKIRLEVSRIVIYMQAKLE